MSKQEQIPDTGTARTQALLAPACAERTQDIPTI